jgi:hypothetical protein
MVMQGQDTSNVRCCPVCKQTSHFVVPHFRHVTDPVRTPALPSPFFTPQVPDVTPQPRRLYKGLVLTVSAPSVPLCCRCARTTWCATTRSPWPRSRASTSSTGEPNKSVYRSWFHSNSSTGEPEKSIKVLVPFQRPSGSPRDIRQRLKQARFCPLVTLCLFSLLS